MVSRSIGKSLNINISSKVWKVLLNSIGKLSPYLLVIKFSIGNIKVNNAVTDGLHGDYFQMYTGSVEVDNAKTGIDGVIYGMIITFILTTVLDKVMFGANAKKFAIIVTDKEAEITSAIDQEVERGSTLLQAEGGHTGSPKAVVMCACSNKQLYQVRAVVRRIDPEAFMIMMDSNEVAGEGFRRL